jgi:hypothetical protein
MTVAALPAVAEYAEDGVSLSFPAPFRFKAAADLVVERIINGVTIPLALGADYTVAGGATDAGGTVTRTAATNGALLQIRRSTPRTQPMVYTTGDRFPAASHEGALDRQMLISQEQDATIADIGRRAIRVPPGEIAPVLPPASARTGVKIMGFNPLTGAPEVQDGSDFEGDTGAPGRDASVLARTSLPLIATAGQTTFLAGFTFDPVNVYVSVNGLDITGADFTVTPANDGVVFASGLVAGNVVEIRSFVPGNNRAADLVVSVKDVDFAGGARGDNQHDDTAAIQAAIDYVSARGGGIVDLPPGTYKVSTRLRSDMFQLFCLVMPSNIWLRGHGKTVSIIRLNDDDQIAGVGAAIRIIAQEPGAVNGITLTGLAVDGNYQNQPKLQNQGGNGGNIFFGYFDGGVPNNVTIEDCASYNAYGQGIQMVGQPESQAANIFIRNNDIYQCSFIGVQVSQFVNIDISHNKITYCGDNGIDIYGFNNSFSAPAIRSGGFIIANNRIVNCGGAGVFPESVANGIVDSNSVEGCNQGVHVNLIGGEIKGIKITNNEAINCGSGYAVTGPMNVEFRYNYASGFTVAGLICGGSGGEASYIKYSGFTFLPANKNLPLVLVVPGTNGFNFVDPGTENFLIEANTNDPTPASSYFVNYSAVTVGSPAPTFRSATNPGATSGMRLPQPRIEGRMTWAAPPSFADNATAVAALGAGSIYVDSTTFVLTLTH